ncbi:MAG: DUF433 domain-containing protein [Chloroflexota bacterium]
MKNRVPRPKQKQVLLGRYIVADPEICHGKPTFRGTRIFVSDVLEMVAEGMAWETIIEQWHGSVTKEAIAESVKLSGMNERGEI